MYVVNLVSLCWHCATLPGHFSRANSNTCNLSDCNRIRPGRQWKSGRSLYISRSSLKQNRLTLEVERVKDKFVLSSGTDVSGREGDLSNKMLRSALQCRFCRLCTRWREDNDALHASSEFVCLTDVLKTQRDRDKEDTQTLCIFRRINVTCA